MVGYISYLYYLLYELLSPFIELFGLLTIVLAYMVNLINVPFMIMFFLIYALYGAVLTITAFFARIYTQNIRLSVLDVVKAVYLCIAESVFFRFIQAFTRMTAFFGYKKKKNVWGQIKRQKIQLHQTSEEKGKWEMRNKIIRYLAVITAAMFIFTPSVCRAGNEVYVAGMPDSWPFDFTTRQQRITEVSCLTF